MRIIESMRSVDKRMKLLAGVFMLAALLLCSACSSGAGASAESEAAKELHTLHLSVDYESNLFLAVYDIDVLVDGESVAIAKQGDVLTQDVSLEAGNHTLRFQEEGHSSVAVETTIKIEGETYYSCSLKSHMSDIELKDERMEAAAAHDERVADEAAEQAEKERIEQDAKEKADAVVADLNACVGKTAAAARKVAKKHDYRAYLLDSEGTDITDLYDAVAKDAGLRKVEVKKVELAEFFGEKSASFTLSYTLPDEEWFDGKTLAKAIEKVKTDGIPFTIVADNTGMNMMSSYEAGDLDPAAMSVVGADWAIDYTSIEFRILSKEMIEADQKQRTMRDSLDAKLDSIDAWQAVQRYGKDMYGPDFKVHYIIGRLAEEPWDEDTWFLKAECDVYGNSGYTVEAKVTGTTDSPVVFDFNVY